MYLPEPTVSLTMDLYLGAVTIIFNITVTPTSTIGIVDAKKGRPFL
jgi:hypothetical protein